MTRIQTSVAIGALASITLGVLVFLFAPKTHFATADRTQLFANGWQNRTELGCTVKGLLDGRGGRSTSSWQDFGPAYPGLCQGTVPDAEIIDTTGPDGLPTRALRVNQKAGNQNGTDFRMGQNLGTQQDVTVRYWTKYGELVNGQPTDWQWASADHKTVIFMAQGNAQTVYINVRGSNSSEPGYIVVHVLPSDTRFDATNRQMSVGVWHFIEAHVVAGSHGKVEVRVDGVLAEFPPSDNGFNILDLNTGPNIVAFKLDTTYNAGSFIPSSGFRMLYDLFTAHTGGF